MAIHRQALIIGAENIAGQTRAHGVRLDKSRMYRFLRSTAGGAWRPSEIELLENPLLVGSARLRRTLDYQVTYFAGHGYTDEGEVYLCLNDHQDVPVSALPIHAPKALVIIDACRTIIRTRPTLIEKAGAAYAEIGAVANPTHRMIARWIYERAIVNAEPGAAVMFASEYDESAWGSQDGGYFTRSLIEGAEAWSRPTGEPSARVLSALGALSIAKSRIGPIPQTPTIYAAQRSAHLPFAVRL